ncbi:uncharacterized protein LOC143024448 [Oratosquilla oratoria]|uniref:uncharacterized protein LOC143024448 n=1 Tax=Oratosquilla oratoria TaxID=337810 RepID=UPI003F7619A4
MNQLLHIVKLAEAPTESSVASALRFLKKMSRKFEDWRLRRMIDYLGTLRVTPGTSVISIYVTPDEGLRFKRNLLVDEARKASNIRSPLNRASVQDGIRALSEHLKMLRSVPPTGFACFFASSASDALTDKERKVKIEVVPHKNIIVSTYRCDKEPFLKPLQDLSNSDDDWYGFVVVTGAKALFARVSGGYHEVLGALSANVPRKHCKGGQSAQRFERLRRELRNAYLKKICKETSKFFVDEESHKVNVRGLFFAGSAELKDELLKCPSLDERLRKVVLQVVTVAYGGRIGLSAAIDQTCQLMGDHRFKHQQNLLQRFFDSVHANDNLTTYGLKNVLRALAQGQVEVLLAWEELPYFRVVETEKNEEGEAVQTVRYFDGGGPVSDQEGREPLGAKRRQVLEQGLLIDWLYEEYGECERDGVDFELIVDNSSLSSQFVKGFGGLVAILRYALEDDMKDDLEDFETDIEGENMLEYLDHLIHG